jgi:hypothetical protein
MDKEKLKELADSKNYISGIYNYCDRWCEKCPFTGQCLSFEMSKNSIDNKNIITDKKFWSDLENSFRIVKDMLDDYMKEHNITYPSNEEKAYIETEMKLIDKLVKADPILMDAQVYNRNATQILNDNLQLLNESADSSNEVRSINSKDFDEAIEVIYYYKSLIFVKISRALHSHYSNDKHNIDGYEEDKLVSAKIAIIAVERSMTAWHFIFENYKSSSDIIIDILLLLNNIKTKLEKLIPQVISYKRPYFD